MTPTLHQCYHHRQQLDCHTIIMIFGRTLHIPSQEDFLLWMEVLGNSFLSSFSTTCSSNIGVLLSWRIVKLMTWSGWCWLTMSSSFSWTESASWLPCLILGLVCPPGNVDLMITRRQNLRNIFSWPLDTRITSPSSWIWQTQYSLFWERSSETSQDSMFSITRLCHLQVGLDSSSLLIIVQASFLSSTDSSIPLCKEIYDNRRLFFSYLNFQLSPFRVLKAYRRFLVSDDDESDKESRDPWYLTWILLTTKLRQSVSSETFSFLQTSLIDVSFNLMTTGTHIMPWLLLEDTKSCGGKSIWLKCKWFSSSWLLCMPFTFCGIQPAIGQKYSLPSKLATEYSFSIYSTLSINETITRITTIQIVSTTIQTNSKPCNLRENCKQAQIPTKLMFFKDHAMLTRRIQLLRPSSIVTIPWINSPIL